MDIKTQNKKRLEAAAEIQRLAKLNNEEGRSWSGEDQEKWEFVNKEYNDLKREIDQQIRLAELDRDNKAAIDLDTTPMEPRASAPGLQDRGRNIEDPFSPTVEDRCLALQGWMMRGGDEKANEPRPEHLHAARKCGVDLSAKFFDFDLRGDHRQVKKEWRANMGTSAGSGGDTIPEGFVNNFERALLEFGGVRQVATVLRTASGNDLPWPTSDDTGNMGAFLAEAGAVAQQDATTSVVTFKAFKYTSKEVRVSPELIQDSAFNLASILGAMLGERIGRIENQEYTVGVGTTRPNGIVTAATLGKTVASNSATTSDELIDLLHSVDPAYRNGASWMMHDTVLSGVRKLTESSSLNQYVWQPGMQAGIPDRLFGFPVTVNQSMATQATVTKHILFGNMAKYVIRDVAGFRIKHLTELHALSDLESFVAFHRTDGNLLDAGSNPIKYIQSPV